VISCKLVQLIRNSPKDRKQILTRDRIMEFPKLGKFYDVILFNFSSVQSPYELLKLV
jgi:hypothetical protein